MALNDGERLPPNKRNTFVELLQTMGETREDELKEEEGERAWDVEYASRASEASEAVRTPRRGNRIAFANTP